MMKSVAVALAALAVMGGEARAETETSRRTMVVEWFHMPRKTERLLAHQQATLPGATLSYLRWDDGDRMFVFRFDSGIACSTHVERGDIARLTCGLGEAYYDLEQRPGMNAKVEHVTNEPVAPAAERKSEPAPKAKVRL